MATLIPSRNSCLPRMTTGERIFSRRLEQKLEDDYLIWYDVPVGAKQSRPDFTIFHPGRGILVLELKDWKLETLQSIDKNTAVLLTNRGLVNERNPIFQARSYAIEINMALEKDPQLIRAEHQPHAGKVLMPWGYGAVLTKITRKQFDESGLGETMPDGLTICSDEISETVDAEEFQQRLWHMFLRAFPCKVTLPQIDRVRWHLFPEIRVIASNGQFGLFKQADTAPDRTLQIPDLIKVMDWQQEQLARSLGDGHRVIHGVAGSGKTMILGYRCIHLARALHKPTLVLCFNRTLAARLEQVVAEHGLQEKVSVRSFHRWCRDMLIAYHIELPAVGEDFSAELVRRVTGAVERNLIPRAQYGAVLIDEGHDFEPDWYRIVVQMVDPSTSSLLVLYDDAQNIYGGGKSRLGFTWKSVGIEASGRRTTILKINYRNTLEILSVARAFAGSLLDAKAIENDLMPLVSPESAGRRGAFPELLRVEGNAAEMRLLIERIRDEMAHGRRLSDMAVLFRSNWHGKEIEKQLNQAKIKTRLANDVGKSQLFDHEDAIKIISMHSSKGLEFAVVFIPHLGQMPGNNEQESEGRLLYVAMTRATERLVLLHHSDSAFTHRISTAIEELQREAA